MVSVRVERDEDHPLGKQLSSVSRVNFLGPSPHSDISLLLVGLDEIRRKGKAGWRITGDEIENSINYVVI